MKKAYFNYLGETKNLNKIWNFSIGSCHAYTLLRADLREQLKIAHDECGFKYIRFHGIFMDQMHVVDRDVDGKLIFSFFNIDNIYDYLISIGVKPFIELSFMPEVLASEHSYVFRYKGNTTPPKNYAEWDYFIENFVKHLIQRYGLKEVQSWFFEVWNEPNLGGDINNYNTGFFFGTQEDYFKLYEHTARAIKNIEPSLKVGGPATSNNQWIEEFIEFTKKSNVPLDYISTHHYPSDVIFGDNCEGGLEFKRLMNDVKTSEDKVKAYAEFNKFKSKLWKYIPKFTPISMSQKVRKESKDYPLFYTEQSSLSGIDSDGEFGASYIVEINLRNMDNCDGYSYWCLSDIFEEGFQHSKEFNGGFGLFTYHGIKKASYNAYHLLNKLDGQMLTSIYEDDSLTIRVIKGETKDFVVITNYDGLDKDVPNLKVNVTLGDFKGTIKRINRYVIDKSHSNSLREYEKQSYSSDYLSNDEIQDLKDKTDLYKEEFKDYKINQNNLELNTEINGQAVVLLEIIK